MESHSTGLSVVFVIPLLLMSICAALEQESQQMLAIQELQMDANETGGWYKGDTVQCVYVKQWGWTQCQ